MANHKSSLKRVRQTKVRTIHNRYAAKTMRNALKKIRLSNNSDEVKAQFPIVCSMLDKLAKRNVIHKNKAGNLKAKLAKKVNSLNAAV
ncbi:MAG: 30S ribosomal protein S20 [Tannerella sp.]|jgi:small subunit ribosomal protein S20|nr:30S ribosomal protein S20 [Tannerella sp.]